MQIVEFKSIVMTFVDPGSELLFDNTTFAICVNGDLITANISTRSGDVYVDEGTGPQSASNWIIVRLARLPLLASRLRETVPATKHFVAPAISLLSTLERQPNERAVRSNNGLTLTLDTLDSRSPLETMVLYITSDAGEGKTSLINELAREQAQRFIDKKADWLLVPIPLGGRNFLRFDDITSGVMQNRYRFPFLYYQSFLALVRMGVVVPAFDGFEEMFVESSSGEALSAMGILVGALDSRGSIVVAARKAYFEFENLRSQERLFDTIKGFSVGFGKVELHRWAKTQFIEYCGKREVDEPEDLYQRLSERLTPDHALLTRAILVKRLVDVAKESLTFDDFLNQLQKSGADFFAVFVRGLIEREANDKWLDRDLKDGVGTPIFTVDEHCDLLSQVALSMWEAKVDFLKRDTLEFAADYFCEMAGKSTSQAGQVRDRIRGHAMLVPSTNSPNAVQFDHEEFQHYFLGEGIARQLRPMTTRARAEVLGTFRRGPIPRDAMLALFRALTRNGTLDRVKAIHFLLDVAAMDAQASYTQENVAQLILPLLNGIDGSAVRIHDLSLGHDSLRDKKVAGVNFEKCYFSESSLEFAELVNLTFSDCHFVQLRLTDSTKIDGVVFQRCDVDGLILTTRNREIWDPAEIRQQLEDFGVTFREEDQSPPEPAALREPDPECADVQKLVRYFMRSTHVSESVIRIKLGGRGQAFIDETLPLLLRHGVFIEIQNVGAGGQRRFRLNVSLQTINNAIVARNGNFADFLAQFM